MKIEFTPVRADYLAFHKKANGGVTRKVYWILFAGVFATMELISLTGDFFEILGPYQNITLIGAIILGVFLLRLVLVRKANKKYDADFSESTFSDSITLTYDDKGLTSEQTHQKTNWKWSAFCKVSVENGDIFIWLTKLQGVVIPARAIKDDEQLKELTEYFQSKIG